MPDSAIGAVTELAASQHSVILRSQAAEAGLSRSRVATAIRQGWLEEPYHGVLAVAGSPRTFEHRVLSAVWAVDGAAASHRAAARLHGLDGYDRMNVVEVSVQRRQRWQYPDPVVSHHQGPFEDCDITSVNGIPTTTVARTLADLGAVVKNWQLVRRALTDARRRGVSVHLLRDTVERLHRPGPSGTGPMRRLLAGIPYEGTVTESWFEELVARCLVHPSLPEVVPQYRIRGPKGAVVARVDFAIPSVRLAIEAHSRRHHFGPLAEALDEQRDVRLAALDWEVVYVGWHQAKSPAAVAKIIAEIVAARRSASAA